MNDEQRRALLAQLDGRASEIRARLLALGQQTSVTEGESAEIAAGTTELRTLETRRSALAVGVNPDPEPEPATPEPPEEVVSEGDSETRERRRLRGEARVGDFVRASLLGRPVSGASAEYAAAVECDGLLPLDLLGPEHREAEARAVTPGPTAGTQVTTRPTVPFAFARTDAAALGVSMPMVPGGQAAFPALTTAPPAGFQQADGAAANTAGAFTVTTRNPKRVTGQFLARIEDIALFPRLERDLRQGIAGAMADAVDSQIINGDGQDEELSSLFHQATNVNVASAVETFQSGVARFAALVDGKHSHGWGDIRALIGTATFAKYAALYNGAVATPGSDMSLFDYLMGKMGTLRVSTRVGAVASNGQKGIAVLAGQGQPIQVPVWRGVELITDPYTQAAKGQRVVTAVSLLSSPFIPYGSSQVKEVHPKLS